jgi:hypothetical protein
LCFCLQAQFSYTDKFDKISRTRLNYFIKIIFVCKVEHKRIEDSDDQGEIVDDSFQRTVNSKDVKGNTLQDKLYIFLLMNQF